MANDDDTVEALEAAIIASLMTGQVSIGDIAERSGTTVRTLQRRLGERETTFSKVLEGVRIKAAQSMLGENVTASHTYKRLRAVGFYPVSTERYPSASQYYRFEFIVTRIITMWRLWVAYF